MLNKKLVIKNLIIFIFFLIFSTLSVHAEFLETSPNVFQHINGEYKIVITNDGVFAAQTKKIDVTNFKTHDLTKDNVISSCFLRYNADLKRFEELLVNGKLYLIDGSLNIKLGKLAINVDELNTYASFVVYDKDTDDSAQGILGVIGTSVVTNTTGSAFVALLEANSFSSDNTDNKIFSYDIVNNNLYHNKKELEEGQNIGKKFDRTKFTKGCLADNAVIVDSKDLSEIKKLGAKKDKHAIENIFNSRKSKDIVKDLLIIRVEDSSVILLDYINAEVKIAKILGETNSSNKTLCLIKNIDME